MRQHFDFSGRQDLYTAYIPWAVAFGVADEWAAKYKLETGEEPPAPHYFASTLGYTGGSFAASMADDFSSTVSSAISAYEATQSSSSSGGDCGRVTGTTRSMSLRKLTVSPWCATSGMLLVSCCTRMLPGAMELQVNEGRTTC